MRVWLDPAGWRAAVVAEIDGPTVDAIDRWAAAGRAFVARRREPASDADCFLALARPGKVRIAFVIDRAAVRRIAPPLRLAEALAAAPAHRQAALQDLVDASARVGVVFHVYGSFAWQCIAGEPYVTESSDLDLLWRASDPQTIAAVIALLAAWERTAGLRADGELLLPDGDAVSWRELASGAARVLVKRDDGVALRVSPLGTSA